MKNMVLGFEEGMIIGYIIGALFMAFLWWMNS